MEKGKPIIYVDGFGREHEALVTAINGLHPDHASVVYVDPDAPEAENVKKIFDVVHISQATGETNPNLPDFHVHVLKEVGDDHVAPPADHPQHDHPFASQIDKMHALLGIQSKPVTPADRPAFYAAVSAHLGATEDKLPSAVDLDAVAAEQEVAEETGPPKRPTIAELEAILNSNENLDVKVNPDGSVTAVPAAPPEVLPAAVVPSFVLHFDKPLDVIAPAAEPDVAAQLDADKPAVDADSTGTP